MYAWATPILNVIGCGNNKELVEILSFFHSDSEHTFFPAAREEDSLLSVSKVIGLYMHVCTSIYTN